MRWGIYGEHGVRRTLRGVGLVMASSTTSIEALATACVHTLFPALPTVPATRFHPHLRGITSDAGGHRPRYAPGICAVLPIPLVAPRAAHGFDCISLCLLAAPFVCMHGNPPFTASPSPCQRRQSLIVERPRWGA